MKGAILQPNYLPWKGVFDMIHSVDVFVFLDDVQFTYRDWRTRNQIKTANGPKWISVPVSKCSRDTLIKDVRISEHENWQQSHYRQIVDAYKKAPHFDYIEDFLKAFYDRNKWENLNQMNQWSTIQLAQLLGVETRFYSSNDLGATGNKDDRLIEICKSLGITEYLSGPAAKAYIREERFAEAEIELRYMEYKYPNYPQIGSLDFVHGVSVIDLLANCGMDAPNYIWNWRA